MKFKRFKSSLACLALVTALALPAAAQLEPTRLRPITDFPTSIAASAVSNLSIIVSVPQDRNMTWSVCFAGSGAGTDNLHVWAKPSVDGTNFSTGAPMIFTTAANGTTGVVGATNINKAALEGYRSLMFYAASNASAARVLYTTNFFVGSRN